MKLRPLFFTLLLILPLLKALPAEVHLADEIVEVFEADAFHAGMDEVFYIGEEVCPRCSGKDKAELFAGEVNKIRDHLAESGKDLWIWGDRLIDGKSTGMGMWETSENDTYAAIDMISKNVVICDWHYERADPSAALFALKEYYSEEPEASEKGQVGSLNLIIQHYKGTQ